MYKVHECWGLYVICHFNYLKFCLCYRDTAYQWNQTLWNTANNMMTNTDYAEKVNVMLQVQVCKNITKPIMPEACNVSAPAYMVSALLRNPTLGNLSPSLQGSLLTSAPESLVPSRTQIDWWFWVSSASRLTLQASKTASQLHRVRIVSNALSYLLECQLPLELASCLQVVWVRAIFQFCRNAMWPQLCLCTWVITRPTKYTEKHKPWQ